MIKNKVLKNILTKEIKRINNKRDKLLKEIHQLEIDIKEIETFLNNDVEEPVTNDDVITPVEQTVVVCMYKETGDNAPYMENVLWYPVFKNPNTEHDITEFKKTSKVIVGMDHANQNDEVFLKKLAAHFELDFLGV